MARKRNFLLSRHYLRFHLWLRHRCERLTIRQRKEELRYHPKRAEQIDEAQPIDDFLSLPYREPFTTMAEP